MNKGPRPFPYMGEVGGLFVVQGLSVSSWASACSISESACSIRATATITSYSSH
jgi:hypothetical protein